MASLLCHSLLKVRAVLFRQRLILLIRCQELLLQVHCEWHAPLDFILVLWYEVEVQVRAGAAVSAVVDLVGAEGFVQRLGYFIDISEVTVAVLVAQVDDLAECWLLATMTRPL